MNLRNFARLVSNQAAAVQSKARVLLDFTEGSILRAIAEANAATGLWLQGLAISIYKFSRAATSKDTDLDSWYADFSFRRLDAQSAVGSVVFSRFTFTQEAWVNVGAEMRTADGSQSFLVVADTSHPCYDINANAYLVAAGVQSLSVPVQAKTPGTAGNVLANTVTSLVTQLSGIDTVNNPASLIEGSNAEEDDPYRARFPLYMASLSKATRLAVESAIRGTRLGVDYSVNEYWNPDGTQKPGWFLVVADDGTGEPSDSFIATIQDAVNQVRGLGIMFGVLKPIKYNVTVQTQIELHFGYDQEDVEGRVGQAMTTFINSRGLGKSLFYKQVGQVIFNASPGVKNILLLTANGATADIIADGKTVIRTVNTVVSV